MAQLLWSIVHGTAAMKYRTGRGSGLSGYASISKVSLFLLSWTYIAFHYKKCFLWSRKLLKNQKSLMWKIQSYSANITCVLLYFSGLFISLFLTNEMHSSPISLLCLLVNDETRGHVGKTEVPNGSTPREGSLNQWVPKWPCEAEPSAHPQGTCKMSEKLTLLG